MSTVDVRPPVKLADLTDPAAAVFGVTGELAASTGAYTVSAAWAEAIGQAGFGGLIYHPRFTPGSEIAVALFGDAGAGSRRGVLAVTPLGNVLADLEYVVEEVPDSRIMWVDDDQAPEPG